MGLFNGKKSSPTLLKLKELFQAEAEEKRMKESVKWIPWLRHALEEYGYTLDQVKDRFERIFGPVAQRDMVMRQMGTAFRRRLNVDAKNPVAKDKLWRLMAMSGPSEEYTNALNQRDLKLTDLYVATVFSWAKDSEGLSESDAQARADAASARVQQLLKELEQWDEHEVTMRSVVLSDGRKTVSPFFAFAPDVLAGDAPTLLDWARQNPEKVRG